MSALWNKLPEIMRDLPQWAVAGADKAPMAVGPNGKLRNVSVTRPSEWMTFELACAVAAANAQTVTTSVSSEGLTINKTGFDIGFILTESDPVSCIDLDVKDTTTHPSKPDKWTTAEDFQFYLGVVHHYDSFTERSRSGKGLHIWVEGKIGRGFRRGGMEVYSQERFIICTGDIMHDRPVRNRAEMLSNMVTQMRPIASKIELVEFPAEHDDWYVLDIAFKAGNADKFISLWQGKWRELEYPSQSEADLSLMSMLAFYTDSNSQCRRMFRDSGLGQREKTRRSDYHVNRLLKVIRSRQEKEAKTDLSGIMQAAEDKQRAYAAEMVMQAQGGVPAAVGVETPFGVQPQRTVVPLQVQGQGDPVVLQAPLESQLAQMAPVSESMVKAGESGLPWPPGFLGTLAKYIYDSSYLPIKEVSLVSALGLMAGICGKAWHIPKSGLNLYIILVARSAIGKEGMHDGISNLVMECAKTFPNIAEFVDFTEYASGPGLMKACLAKPSFVNVSGEWGRRLKRLALEDGRDGPLATLRTQMTNLYQKSGPQSIAGGMGYSNQESNIASVMGVAYSMIGESTPGTFYESLTPSMMEDGFLSRFLVIGYDGDRPDENPRMLLTPDTSLKDHLISIAYGAIKILSSGDSQAVQRTESAAAILKAFSDEAASHIKQTDDESRRQMWNRAALKVLRVAAIMAVCDNPAFPVMDVHHVEWAILLIRSDITMMKKRMASGDVGSGDTTRQQKLMSVIKEYRDRAAWPPSYKVNEDMRASSVVTRHFLQLKTQQLAIFNNHKLGHAKALDEALAQCVSNGYLMKVQPDKLVEVYSHHGQGFRILHIPDYDAMASNQ